MVLNVLQLEEIRRNCAQWMPVIDYTVATINAAAQTVQEWIDANRGSLPAIFTDADLTAGQRSAVSTLLGSAFTNGQKLVLFNAVAPHNAQAVATPVLPEEDPAVLAAIRDALRAQVSAAIDAVRPGLTNAQKLQALRNALRR